MEDKIQSLRRKYEGFKKGEGDLLAVRDEALSVLEDAKRRGDRDVLEEIEDMLMDLEFSIEENRCNCHCKCSIC